MEINAFNLEEDFELVIKEYSHNILKYCHSILCDYHEAEDVTQITFMKAYKKRSTFKDQISISAWLYRIAYTSCIDTLRKKKFYSFFQKEEEKKIESIQGEYISEEVRSALLKLKPDERGLVFNRVIDDKSFKELEGVYNTSATTLRKRYERAKKKLANNLKEVYK